MEEPGLTRKEKRALAKEEKAKRRQQESDANRNKKLVIFLVVFALVGFLGYRAYQFFTSPVPQVVAEPIQLTETDRVKGEKDANVTLIKYSDFQCPACANAAPMVDNLLLDFPEELRVVYRHFPLISIHRHAFAAARAAEAAGAQDKFWEMHDMLFERQMDWANERDATDKFIAYGQELGLDVEKFRQDFESKEVEEKVNADLLSGNRLRVDSTPTFFLNGAPVLPRSYEHFKELIEGEIERQGSL